MGSSTVGVAAVGACLLAFCCVKQRAAGRKEREAADREYEKQTAELLQFRSQLNQERMEKLANNGSSPQIGSNGGITGRMKRLSQSLGIGRSNAGGGGGAVYQGISQPGEYHRF